MKIKNIDILQIILERICEAEDWEHIEFNTSMWYAMAVKDLAIILWLDPDKYWTKQ